MHGILKYSKNNQKAIFENTAQKMGVRVAIIEKDYWVCLVLEYLFHKSEHKNNFAFKGGTSLSKCFGLIKRFSEDIDIILNWELLGFKKDEPWFERTISKQGKFNNEVNRRTEKFISETFLQKFVTEFSKTIGKNVKAEVDETEKQTINFYYPRIYDNESILPLIKIEMGALAAWTPTEQVEVTPYIFEIYPKLANQKFIKIKTCSIERTFWEKVTILHREANRPKSSKMPMRYSRHYYDLYCISKSKYKLSALKQIQLLEKVVDFKIKFYSSNWAKYEEAKAGQLKIIPPEYRMNDLENDYKLMSEMFFDVPISFDIIIKELENLENEINSLFKR
jgi:hypothetical protein